VRFEILTVVNIMITVFLGSDVSQFSTQASMCQMNMLPPSCRQNCAPDRRKCSCYREWKVRTGAKRKLKGDGGPKRERIME